MIIIKIFKPEISKGEHNSSNIFFNSQLETIRHYADKHNAARNAFTDDVHRLRGCKDYHYERAIFMPINDLYDEIKKFRERRAKNVPWAKLIKFVKKFEFDSETSPELLKLLNLLKEEIVYALKSKKPMKPIPGL